MRGSKDGSPRSGMDTHALELCCTAGSQYRQYTVGIGSGTGSGAYATSSWVHCGFVLLGTAKPVAPPAMCLVTCSLIEMFGSTILGIVMADLIGPTVRS